MPGHRQSALLLHGLSRPDQRWILAQLADNDRHILEQYLAELKELGIPAEPALVEQASGARAVAAAGPLHSASATAMLRVLADEPAWMVRHVLALADWPWRQAFLAAHTDSQRARLAAHSEEPLAPQTAERLMALLGARLALGDGGENAQTRPARTGQALTILRAAMRRRP